MIDIVHVKPPWVRPWWLFRSEGTNAMLFIHFDLEREYWIAAEDDRIVGKYSSRAVAEKIHTTAELRGDERGESVDDRKRWARNGASWRRNNSPYSSTIFPELQVDEFGFFVTSDGKRVPENATIERTPRLKTFGLV